MPTTRWNTGDDFDRARDNSGFAHDGFGDHAGRGTLQRGYQYGSMTRGLVAYYPFDGSVRDATPLGNDGTDNTSAGYNGSGQVGSDSKDFDDGTNDYITGIDFGFADSDSFTIAGWIQFRDSGEFDYLAGYVDQSDNSERIYVYKLSDDTPGASIGNATDPLSISGSTTLSTGTWYHLGCVYDAGSTELRLYLDGSLEVRSSGTVGDPTTDHSTFYYGARNDGGTAEYFLNGLIDDLRIYDRALSQPEVEALANLTATQGTEVTESDVPSDGDGGVSRYEFEGDVTDSWGSNDGTDDTSAGYVTGVYGSAKDFDGTDDVVDVGVPVVSSAASSFTIATWVNFDNLTQNHPLVLEWEPSPAYILYYANGDGTLTFQVRQSDGTNSRVRWSDANFTEGSWIHVTGVADGTGGETRLYADGSLADTDAWDGTISADEDTEIGAETETLGWYTDGQIDDVRIYDWALGPVEVERLYDLGSWRIPPGETL